MLRPIKNLASSISRQFLPNHIHRYGAKLVNKSLSRLYQAGTRTAANINMVDRPLLYISQPPRSGGTLLRSLFDGHEQCLVVPEELAFEKNGYHWRGTGTRNQRSVESIFQRLENDWTYYAIVNGLRSEFSFEFSKAQQRNIFKNQAEKRHPESDRDWLDLYFTSFFHAWYNCRNFQPDKTYRYTVAFCPYNKLDEQSIRNFFTVYPDGHRIQVIRDPRGWWASEQAYGNQSKELASFFQKRWTPSLHTGMKMAKAFPETYHLIHFEQLVQKPEVTMNALCEMIDLEFHEMLLHPTTNGRKQKPNSSFNDQSDSITPEASTRWKKYLSLQEKKHIKKNFLSDYENSRICCICC